MKILRIFFQEKEKHRNELNEAKEKIKQLEFKLQMKPQVDYILKYHLIQSLVLSERL